ncbi:hypothetical protein GLOTRDRAFT_100221 [Gloeophyllum trabeum ATCC 11539]|uniref:Uncharacterized protein n=1 Tax=Gloeophyllum trabeum (strain ATCC 11539 / FP-39264 / Madison 617) TaxID=670483 RepID=S7Q3J8_GLOTA|nr:uncharacterized protein GLOTRDRAFT_100221 [Gloeophyllum trabeum ATCC 11539]EPQ54556.1 hypothetical protein GLOTRDRAFT_100221 [Gloeophyllum trabeum ATCC 11539]
MLEKPRHVAENARKRRHRVGTVPLARNSAVQCYYRPSALSVTFAGCREYAQLQSPSGPL